MEGVDLVKSYLEIGILGLCSITVIAVLWLLIKKIISSNTSKDKTIKDKDDIIEDKFNIMIELLQKQNQEYQEQQSENTKVLIDSIIHGVTSHVPSIEENDKLTKISTEIDNILQNVLLDTKASRVSLVQYHNGGKGVNKQSFLKMSMTNEQVQLGVKPLITEFKDQFRSVLGFFIKELGEKGYCYIPNVENTKNIDTSVYSYMKDRDIEAIFGKAIKNKDNYTIGFISIVFNDKSLVDLDSINKAFNDKHGVVETLLSL